MATHFSCSVLAAGLFLSFGTGGCALPPAGGADAGGEPVHGSVSAGIGPHPNLLGSQDGYGVHPDGLPSVGNGSSGTGASGLH